MRYRNCPACGEPTAVGSHWDCIFDLLAEWVEERDREKARVQSERMADLARGTARDATFRALPIQDVTKKEGE
jgi:hypothetical protein